MNVYNDYFIPIIDNIIDYNNDCITIMNFLKIAPELKYGYKMRYLK